MQLQKPKAADGIDLAGMTHLDKFRAYGYQLYPAAGVRNLHGHHLRSSIPIPSYTLTPIKPAYSETPNQKVEPLSVTKKISNKPKHKEKSIPFLPKAHRKNTEPPSAYPVNQPLTSRSRYRRGYVDLQPQLPNRERLVPLTSRSYTNAKGSTRPSTVSRRPNKLQFQSDRTRKHWTEIAAYEALPVSRRLDNSSKTPRNESVFLAQCRTLKLGHQHKPAPTNVGSGFDTGYAYQPPPIEAKFDQELKSKAYDTNYWKQGGIISHDDYLSEEGVVSSHGFGIAGSTNRRSSDVTSYHEWCRKYPFFDPRPLF